MHVPRRQNVLYHAAEDTVGIAMLEVTIDLLGGEPSGGHVLGLGARPLRWK